MKYSGHSNRSPGSHSLTNTYNYLIACFIASGIKCFNFSPMWICLGSLRISFIPMRSRTVIFSHLTSQERALLFNVHSLYCRPHRPYDVSDQSSAFYFLITHFCGILSKQPKLFLSNHLSHRYLLHHGLHFLMVVQPQEQVLYHFSVAFLQEMVFLFPLLLSHMFQYLPIHYPVIRYTYYG